MLDWHRLPATAVARPRKVTAAGTADEGAASATSAVSASAMPWLRPWR